MKLAITKTPRNQDAERFHGRHRPGVRGNSLAGTPAVVLSRVWFRVSGRLCRRTFRSRPIALRDAGGDNQLLVFAAGSRLVAPVRIRGGPICPCRNGRDAVADSSAPQTDQKQPEQSHAPSALQQFLLLASDSARTRTRFGNRGLGLAADVL